MLPTDTQWDSGLPDRPVPDCICGSSGFSGFRLLVAGRQFLQPQFAPGAVKIKAVGYGAVYSGLYICMHISQD